MGEDRKIKSVQKREEGVQSNRCGVDNKMRTQLEWNLWSEYVLILSKQDIEKDS